MQGKDNRYYLKHLFSSEWNGSGCIFLDSRNRSDFSDRHSIIYGHHMKNGSMFSGLTEYKKQEFYNEHPIALLLTPNKNYGIEIFAGYVASAQNEAWEVAFPQTRILQSGWIKPESARASPVKLPRQVTDQILTLSTCSYGFNNARFVLLGVLKPEK